MKCVRKRQIRLQNRLLCFVFRAGDISYIRAHGTLSSYFSLIHIGLLLIWTG